LSLYRSDDYERAGVPMLPVVAGARETRRQILIYSIALVPVTLLPTFIGLAGVVYGAVAAVLGALFLSGALSLWRRGGEQPARRLFAYSILYLFLIFASLLAERGLGLVA
jgi:protoheme IX farnesyltransferase